MENGNYLLTNKPVYNQHNGGRDFPDRHFYLLSPADLDQPGSHLQSITAVPADKTILEHINNRQLQLRCINNRTITYALSIYFQLIVTFFHTFVHWCTSGIFE